MKFRKYLLLFFVVVLLGGCVNQERNDSILITDFNGLKPWLNKENDSLYIINFWATWCLPCVKEFPDFERINSEYANKEVKVLMVNLDFPDQVKKRVSQFLKARKSKLDVVVLDDPNQNYWINQVDSSWCGAIPATLVYSKGKRLFFESELSYTQLDSIIKSYNITNQ